MVGFFLAGAALAATAWFGAAALRLQSTAEFLLGLWLIVCAEVVAAAEVLSLAHAIAPLGYALFEGGALALVLGAWTWVGRPRPPLSLPRGRGLDPMLAVLAIAACLAFGYELFLVVATPPNTWDSMHYHLARAAAWRSQHSLGYFPTHNGMENTFPQDSELFVLWTFVLLGRDVLAALPQLLAGLAATASVYVIARRLGHGARGSAFAALLFPTLTIVALESVSTQNDLIEASFVAAAVAFGLGRGRATVALAGVALGLAVGTKFTFAFAIPALVAVGLLTIPRRRLAALCAATVVGFALVGAYAYVQNLIEIGRLQGRSTETETLPPVVTPAGTVSSVARITYRLIDFSGFHVPTRFLAPIPRAGKDIFQAVGIQSNPAVATAPGTTPFDFGISSAASEDTSAFGPLGVLLLLPLSIGFLCAWLMRKADRTRGALALALPLYIVAIAIGTRWNFYADRFLISPVALTLPLAPSLFKRPFVRLPVLAIGITAMALALAYDRTKPTGLDGTEPVWTQSRIDVQTITLSDMRPVLEAVAARVPKHARLGIDLAPIDWEYPFWGPTLGRQLVWLPEQSSAGLDWVILGSNRTTRPPGRWCAQRFSSAPWTLLHRC